MAATGEKYTEARRAVLSGQVARDPEPNALPLFDTFERSNPDPATIEEDSFTFLNRIDQPYWAEVRRVLEVWFGRYPASEAPQLRRRFRSDLPGQHWGAWWELYLHELFVRLGFRVAAHPPLHDSARRPDFEISRGAWRAYLEATVCFSGIVTDEPGAPGWLTEAINLVDSPGFFVMVKAVEGTGPERLRNRQISGPIQRWLDGLDPDDVTRTLEVTRELPELILEERGWTVRFEAAPVKPEARGKPDHRVYGGGPAIGGMVDDVEQLRDKLKSKAGRYGRPGLPIITAVLCASSFMEDQDVAQALYGRDAVQILGSGTEIQPIRQRNGFWMHETGSQNRRVSAVLTAVQLHPWNCSSITPRLWFNPWAEHRLAAEFPFPSATANDRGKVSFTAREPDMAKILGLPADWPGGVPFPRKAA